jgi:hypothetical protein
MAVLASGGVARAKPDPWTSRPFAIQTHRGAGLPVGRYGFAFDITPAKWLSVMLGTGHNGDGGQLALTWRLRVQPWRNERVGFAVENGFSYGKYVWRNPSHFTRDCWVFFYCAKDQPNRTWEHGVFAYLGASLEARDPEGLDVRFFGGIARVLNVRDGVCDPPGGCSAHSGVVFVWGGLSLGYSFRL